MTVTKYSRPGIGNVGSYQVSGIPYVTGSTILSSSFSTNNGEVRVQFPFVTKSITVVSKSATKLRIHFNSVADGNVINGRHYLTLEDYKDSYTLDMRTKEIYVSLEDATSDGEFELVAELTHIPSLEMYLLTGSGLTE
jgi:hypothetical protein